MTLGEHGWVMIEGQARGAQLRSTLIIWFLPYLPGFEVIFEAMAIWRLSCMLVPPTTSIVPVSSPELPDRTNLGGDLSSAMDTHKDSEGAHHCIIRIPSQSSDNQMTAN